MLYKSWRFCYKFRNIRGNPVFLLGPMQHPQTTRLWLKLIGLVWLVGSTWWSPIHAQGQDKVRLTEVKITGNLRVEDDGIRLHLKSRAGEFFEASTVEQDVKSIFRMGFFDDVRAELSATGILTYAVKEKPYVREIKIQGASQIGREKIETALGIGARTILDRSKVVEGVEKVRRLYNDQGYVNASVDHAITVEANNQAVITLDIVEGGRLLIKRIIFEGNKAFPDGDLRGLINSKQEWIFSFLTSRGVLDRDMLANDVAILSNHYNDHGYVENKVDEPVILRARDGLEVVFRISEGPQYRVGRVEIGGELIDDGRQMLKSVKLTTGQIFRGSRLREDISTLSDMYSNKGFAFVQVDPVTKIDPVTKNVDVALVITRGPPVYFNRILVSGNSKTRDYVVRRELLAHEQELFSRNKINQSKNALQRTGYFEDVQINSKKTDHADTLDLQVDVKEGPTGTFQIGGGYNSGDGFVFNANVTEKNFSGRGQGLSGAFSIATSRQDFILSATDPYFRGTKTSVGLEAFNTMREYTDFDERKIGFGVSSSYPLKDVKWPSLWRSSADSSRGSDELPVDRPPTIWDHMRGGVSYALTRDKISNISGTASQEIRNESGNSLTSAITPSLSYDSRDHFFAATEGTKSSLALKSAGLGGDTSFIKPEFSTRWHYPLLKDPNWGGNYVLALGGSLGYGNNLPLFERYFIGGINSIRGFTARSIAPRAPSGCDSSGKNCTDTEVVGGDKSVVLNAELLFPIYDQYGLRGLTFFDVG
ncbi:MAG: outer membrane protein assembly factor BamA, partial [Deltaproteobacteria bacterium]|nr:outer membrane protein assembly factor BamA [Deltaproteobacteria bacterium]